MCETGCYMLKYMGSLWGPYLLLFLSLEWAIYKVWVLREYRPSSSNQINTLWCLSSCLSVCLRLSTCEMWASHLFFICTVCSPCLFPHTHLLSLLLSLEGWDWISALTLSTAPAPLQMTNLKRRGERIMGRKRTMAPSVVSLSAILWLFHSGLFSSWNRNIQVLRLITLSESVRDRTCLWSKERITTNEISSVSQLFLLDSYKIERAHGECSASKNFLLWKRP